MLVVSLGRSCNCREETDIDCGLMAIWHSFIGIGFHAIVYIEAELCYVTVKVKNSISFDLNYKAGPYICYQSD